VICLYLLFAVCLRRFDAQRLRKQTLDGIRRGISARCCAGIRTEKKRMKLAKIEKLTKLNEMSDLRKLEKLEK
jgi:hypothetical protein